MDTFPFPTATKYAWMTKIRLSSCVLIHLNMNDIFISLYIWPLGKKRFDLRPSKLWISIEQLCQRYRSHAGRNEGRRLCWQRKGRPAYLIRSNSANFLSMRPTSVFGWKHWLLSSLACVMGTAVRCKAGALAVFPSALALAKSLH